jgi:signal transduction histidine kinase
VFNILNCYALDSSNIKLIYLYTVLKILITSFIVFISNINIQSQSQYYGLKIPGSTNAFIGLSKNDEILISSSNGWVVFDGIESKLYDVNTVQDLIDHNVQSHFYSSSDSSIWFATYQSLVNFNPRTEDVKSLQLENEDAKLSSDYYVFHLENDTIYGAISGRLFIYDINNGLYHFPGFILENRWCKLFHFSNEIHLINYFSGEVTYHYILDQNTFRLKEKQILPFKTNDVIQKNGSNFLLATSKGVKTYNIDSAKLIDEVEFLSGKIINSIAKVDDNSWVSSDSEGGLYYSFHNNVKPFSNLIPGNPAIQHIWNIAGKIIFSSYGNGITFFNPEFVHFRNSVYQIKYNPSYVIQFDKDQIMFNSLRQPSIKISTKNNEWTPVPEFNGIRSCVTTPKGIVLTLNSKGREIYILNDKKKINQIVIPNEISNIFFAQYQPEIDELAISTFDGFIHFGTIENNQFFLSSTIKADEAGKGIGYVICSHSLLIASVNEQYGVLHQKIGSNFIFKKQLDIKGKIYDHLVDTKRECIWLGTQYGLLKFDLNRHTIENVNLEGAITGIYTILKDRLDRLWISTGDGLFSYFPETSIRYRYGTEEGVYSSEFNPHTATTLKNGNFIFGGSFGWVEFRPEDIVPNPQYPRIKIRKILLNDNIKYPTFRTKSLSLTHKINTFSIDFAAVTLTGAKYNRVKYRLYPEDKVYLETGSATGFARYSHLNPGKYQFQILAADASGIWMKDPYLLDIIVYPPWWETWWFRLIAIVSLVIIIGYFLRLYYKRQLEKKDLLLREQKLIIEKQEAVQNERTRIAAEMHDDLGSGLTTIKYLSDKAMRNVTDEQEIANIQQISEESNELVRNMSEIIWAMNSRFDTLENLIIYIRRFAYEFLDQHQIAFELKIPDEIPDMKISGEKRRNIFLVVKEALHNVVKHSGSPTATVSVTFDTDLKIAINDQGASEEDNLNENNGNGLYNMKQRMKKIGGTCTFKNGSGWTVTLSLPMEALQN